jgi:hypothetical protein
MIRSALLALVLIGCTPPIAEAPAAKSAPPPVTPQPAVREGTRLDKILAIAKKTGPGRTSPFAPPDDPIKTWPLFEPECRAVLGDLDPLPRPDSQMFACEVETQLNDRAVVVTLQWQCPAGCTRRYIATEAAPLRQVGNQLGYIAVLPSLEAFVEDVKTDCDKACTLRLERVAFGGARAVFADCFAPMVSPGEKWIACRNARGDVLRVPITGGTPTLHTVTPQPNPFPFTGVYYGGMYPDRLHFDNATTLRAVWFQNGASTQVPLPWSE